jgi:hypothetical protein
MLRKGALKQCACTKARPACPDKEPTTSTVGGPISKGIGVLSAQESLTRRIEPPRFAAEAAIFPTVQPEARRQCAKYDESPNEGARFPLFIAGVTGLPEHIERINRWDSGNAIAGIGNRRGGPSQQVQPVARPA